MSDRKKKVVRWLLACGTVAALLYGGWWYLCEYVLIPSIGYEVETEFAELPPDGDEALEAWLKKQPGMATTPRVTRTESRKAIRINLIMSQNLHGRPPFPDVEKACAELGYRGQVAPFRDTIQRRTNE